MFYPNNTGSMNYNQNYGQQNAYQPFERTYNNRPSYIPGKIINSLNDIRPYHIPSNGDVAFFPASDYSCIFAKGWSQEGDRIDTVKYVPEKPAEQIKEQPQSEEAIMLQNILARTQKLEEMLLATGLFEVKPTEPKITDQTTKKGETNNENNGCNHNISTAESGSN